jgi:glycosyltransferase involved in cell wall biosynthesis
MPPARTGVATYSAEVVGALGNDHEIDVFVDEPIAAAGRTRPARPESPERQPAVRSAHDFIWRHHLRRYDLTVFQLGNSSSHDFLWPYLFRYPGLAVLHDRTLHHARAAALLHLKRTGDYRAEFAENQPDTSADLAELAIAGFDTHLYYAWPMTRLIARVSRVTAVHAPLVADLLRAESPGANVETLSLGHGEQISGARAISASERVRTRHGISPQATVFGVYGGLTPEKRVPQILEAFAALLAYHASAHLLLAGAPASHYDLFADISRLGIADRVTVTGYIAEDEAFTDYVAACDVSINLRWPTAGEVSGPWLRALAAGRPTITTDLAHTANIPALDPRTWTLLHAAAALADLPEPVTVSIDILDEDHSLRLAMRRLASDPDLRARLARAAVAYWGREHSPERMLADYQRVIAAAIAAPIRPAAVPGHLRANGTERLEELLRPFGLAPDVWSRI